MRKKVSGPKTTPRARTPRLGKTTIGRIYFFGKKIAAKNRHALTAVPTNHCGPLRENGIINDIIEMQRKTRPVIAGDKLVGISLIRVLSVISVILTKKCIT